MDFEFFESLSPEEAWEFLQGFLETERNALKVMEAAAEQSGIRMDYSVESLPEVLKWILKDVRFMRVPVPASEPEWIRQAHKDGLVEFDEESKYLILRAAFYLGESFVQTYPSLWWTIGDQKYIEQNMPVVAGFRLDLEMAPIMIVENMVRGVFGRGGPWTDVDRAITHWAGDV